MATITREDVGHLTAKINVSVSKEDYFDKYKKDLQNYSKRVNIKGFRQGKAPVSIVKKMYGKQLLADNVDKLLQTELSQYLTDNKIDVLGQPLPVEDNTLQDLDLNNLGDLSFSYELGLAPEFELKGLEDSASYTYYNIEVEDKAVTEELKRIQKQFGEQLEVTDIAEGDVVTFQVTELENGAPKEGGVQKPCLFSVDQIADESIKTKVLALKQGDTFVEDIFKMEDKEEKIVKKHVLGLEEDATVSDSFEFKFESSKRVVPAALNQDLFDKLFPEGDVSNEEELRVKTAERISGYYTNYEDQIFFKNLRKDLLEQNTLELPEAFLKRWLAKSNPEVTEEQIENDYKGFEDELKWSLVRTKIVNKYELKVEQEELIEGFKDQIRQYFGGQADENMVTETANRLLQDQEQVEKQFQETLTKKVIVKVKEEVTLVTEKVNPEQLNELLKD